MRSVVFAFGLALAGIFPVSAAGTVGDYDALLLSLSWSPSFCAEGNKPESQCDPARRIRPYGLVVHGLWPQYVGRKESYPQNCAMVTAVPDELVRALLTLMPSANLIQHQWRKHGSCFSTEPHPYFAMTQRLYGQFRVPESLRNLSEPQVVTAERLREEIRHANPTLTADGFVLRCKRGRLQEIRLCYDQEGRSQRCTAAVLRQENCRGDVQIPAVRP